MSICRSAAVVFVLSLAGLVYADGKTIGWRGDGTGRFPDADPPLTWERKSLGNGEYATKGLAWVTRMPANTASSPIVVGDKLITTSEIGDVICMDKKTGRILWIQSATQYDAAAAELKAKYSTLIVCYAGFDGSTVTLSSNRPLAPATATDPASYETTGIAIKGIKLSDDGKGVAILAKEPLPLGADVTILPSGVKSADGQATTQPVAFRALPGIPADGPMQEFVLGGIKRNIDLATVFKEDIVGEKTCKPAGAGEGAWKFSSSGDGRIDLRLTLGDLTNSVAHAFAYVYSDADRTVQLWTGSDDGIKVTVNGETIYTLAGGRSFGFDVDKIKGVKLRKGWNSLLLGISNGSGGWEFAARIMNEDGTAPPAGVSYQADDPRDEHLAGRAPAPRGPEAMLDRLDALRKQLDVANEQAIAAINAEINATGVAPAKKAALDQAIGRKRDVEKEIYAIMAALDKKAYALDWQQCVFGHSAATPVTDGKLVYVWLATGVTACYDLDGKRQWVQFNNYGNVEHGTYASPALVGDKLITWMNGLTAQDTATGKTLWHVKGRGFDWGSIATIKVGADVLVTCTEGSFVRVSDGQEIWPMLLTTHSTPTPIVEGNCFWGFKGKFMKFTLPASYAKKPPQPDWAIDIKWDAKELPTDNFRWGYISSPLYLDGLIYLLNEGGGLVVLDANTGAEVYRKVLEMSPRIAYWTLGGCSASPALAGKHIYLQDNSGITIVIEPGKTFKQVARNVIENLDANGKQEVNITTPAFDGKCIYLRGPEYMYCAGTP